MNKLASKIIFSAFKRLQNEEQPKSVVYLFYQGDQLKLKVHKILEALVVVSNQFYE